MNKNFDVFPSGEFELTYTLIKLSVGRTVTTERIVGDITSSRSAPGPATHKIIK